MILEDLTLACDYGAPVSCNKTTEVTIKLNGTNTLTDAEDPDDENSSDADTADAFEGAVIKVKSGAELVITGSGTLTADGSDCKNGIKGAATSSITIESGTLNISAANNALASDGSVTVNGGTLNITADNDGIKSEPDDDDEDSLGTITVNGGTITIVSGGDGIQATGTLKITGGTFNITSGGGYKKSVSSDSSAKGIKSDSDLVITGGTFTINSADDAIHSNANVIVTGGTFTIKTGDDGLHADYILAIGGKSDEEPNITIESSYEALEGAQVYLYSGVGNLTASDDGINAANSDLSSYDFLLEIDGGEWYIDASGDGVDSNDDIIMNGGSVIVFASSQNDNAALDYETTFTMNGGTVLAIGTSGMAEAPTYGTYVMFGSSGMGGDNMSGPGQDGMGGQNRPGQGGQSGSSSFSIKAGDTIAVKDSSGNTLATTTALRTANNVVYATVSSGTYYLYINGESAASATASSSSKSSTNSKTVSSATVTISDAEYTGSEVYPDTLTVKLSSKALTEGTDYVVYYANNIEAGQAQAIIVGQGSYTGVKVATYNVLLNGEVVTSETTTTANQTTTNLTNGGSTTTTTNTNTTNTTTGSTITSGDANGDGKITAADVLLIRKYLAKWDVADLIDLDNADANADGKVTAADVLLIRKYLAKWKNIELGSQE